MPKDLTRERILDAAMARMLKFGYRKVTMDEIAQDLTMSKNTIYKHFQSKVEMAEALFGRLQQEINRELSLIEESHKDPVEIISKNIFFLQQRLGPWFEHFLGDIKTEVPDLWDRFLNFRNEKVSEIKGILEKGIKKGAFRKVDPALAVRMYLGAIDHVLNPDFLEKERISFSDALEGVLDIWSSGILKKTLMVLPVILAIGAAPACADSPQFAQWNFKFSGEERFRYEYKKNFDFNQTAKDNGGQFYHRFRLGGTASLTDEYLKPKADIFIEGLDAQTGGHKIKAASNQVDDFDLHQAYVNVHNILGSDFAIKAGRQEFKYGKGRLIAAPTWSNRIRALDGGIIHYQNEGVWGDLLYGQDVKYDDDKFNASRSEDFLAGFYGGYQEHKMAPLVEAYFLDLRDIKGTTDNQRYTVGARLQQTIAEGTVLDLELPYQFGRAGSAASRKRGIKAYAFHADLTKSWEALPWKPKFTAAYDEASGDNDPNDSVTNTFNPIYQSTHEAYGQLDFFRWQNVRNPEISATFSPAEKFKFTPQADFFWLQSKFDSWYNSSGTAVRSKTSGDRGYFVGSEVSLRLYYDINKYLKFESGYAHFFPGGYMKDSGSDDDTDWFYSQLALKF